jgi:hypothetical protein
LVFITWSNCSVVMSAIPPILGHLVGRVVAQLLDGGVDDLLAGLLAADIAGAADGLRH